MATEQDSTQQVAESASADDQQQVSDADPKGDQQIDYKQRYTALKTDYDKVISEHKKEPKEEKMTKNEELEWMRFNSDKIKLCSEEFQQLRAEGIPAQKALDFALKMKGVSQSKETQVRQAEMSSAPATVDRSTSHEEVHVPEAAQRLGVKPETIKKYRNLVEGEK